MKKYFFFTLVLLTCFSATAQFSINPKVGVAFMNLTDPPEGYDFKADVGYQVGVDFRFGKSAYIQPGIFYSNTKTTFIHDSIIDVEDAIIRQSIFFKAMLGYYLISGDGIRLRINAGPSYEVLLSAESKDDKLVVTEDNFNNGTFNLEFGGGLDISILTIDIGYMYGLSNAYDGDKVDIDSKYLGFFFNAGVVFVLGSSSD